MRGVSTVGTTEAAALDSSSAQQIAKSRIMCKHYHGLSPAICSGLLSQHHCNTVYTLGDMAHIILTEDERILRDELVDFLTGHGHQVDAADSLAGFAKCFRPAQHTIAIIDIGLPDGSGLDLVQQLRAQKMNLGIIVLTARAGLPDKLAGLERGADHYLPKSTDLDELAGIVAALQRRLDAGGLSQCWRLQAAGRTLAPPGLPPIDLSPHDFAVLKAIIGGLGLPVSRRAILDALGDDFFTSDPARLDTQMRRLRRKVSEATGNELPIKTLRNEGYLFCEPAEIL
jgi:DNA-binding response OmpR family regulator